MGSGKIGLKNTSGTFQDIQLVHPKGRRMVQTHLQSTRDRKSGKIGLRPLRGSFSESMTILAGETKYNLPAWMADVPDVVRLRNLNPPALVVIEAAPDASPLTPRAPKPPMLEIEEEIPDAKPPRAED
jgi:hypothetical protein